MAGEREVQGTFCSSAVCSIVLVFFLIFEIFVMQHTKCSKYMMYAYNY